MRLRVVTALMAIAVVSQGSVRSASPIQATRTSRFVPLIEQRAPGAFDPARPVRQAAQARYRADAHVLLPLLVTSLRIASRSSVGVASAGVRDVALDSGERVLAYEFYAASTPERARGLDRLGFYREVVFTRPAGGRESVYFGAMSVSKEQTLDEAKKAIAEHPGLAPYDVIEGAVSEKAADATSYRVVLDGRAPDAASFFSRVSAAVDPADAKRKPNLAAPPGRPFEGYSFLAAFESLLQDAASAPSRASGLRTTFIFAGDRRGIEIRDVEADPSRGRDWVARGLVAEAARVRRLECRIVTAAWSVDFNVWIDTRAPESASGVAFVLPLRVEYQPRAFLRLVFERES